MRWTNHDIALLRTLHPQMTAASIAIVMKRSRQSIQKMAWKIGLRKRNDWKKIAAEGTK